MFSQKKDWFVCFSVELECLILHYLLDELVDGLCVTETMLCMFLLWSALLKIVLQLDLENSDKND